MAGALLFALPFLQTPVMADGNKIVVTLFGIGPGAGAAGTVTIENNPNGPDELELEISGLPPNHADHGLSDEASGTRSTSRPVHWGVHHGR